MPSWLTPKKFLFKFSLHVGVVTICSMGIMLHTISFFVNMFGRDPEFKDIFVVVHWFVVLIFVITGFSIYVLGIMAAYKTSSRLAMITTYCLLFHFIFWIVLTVLSFVNNLTLNSFVCIDNRCADRLFIKNGNWRRADDHCNNPSDLRGILLGDIDIEEEEGQGPGSGSGSGYRQEEDDSETDDEDREDDEEDEEERSLIEYVYDHGLGRRTPSVLEKHIHLHARGIQHNDLKDHKIVSRRKRKSLYSPGRKKHRSRKTLKRAGLMPALHIITFNNSEDGSGKSNGSTSPQQLPPSANNFLRTPFGKVGCNAPVHIALSVICALLILCLWYVYPLLVFRAYTQRMKTKTLPRAKSPEKSMSPEK